MRRVLVKVYMLPAEKAAISDKAARAGLTISELMRRLGAAHRVPPPGNAKAIEELLQVNADLARLGNLLKLALDDDAWRDPETGGDVEAIVQDIAARRAELKAAILALR